MNLPNKFVTNPHTLTLRQCNVIVKGKQQCNKSNLLVFINEIDDLMESCPLESLGL